MSQIQIYYESAGVYPGIKGSFAPLKYGPWELPNASILCECTVLIIAHCRVSESQTIEDHSSSIFSLAVLKDEIHVYRIQDTTPNGDPLAS